MTMPDRENQAYLSIALGLPRFGGHLINPAKFRVEVFDDQI